MKNVANLIKKSTPYRTADTTNHEGHPAWMLSDTEHLHQMMMTGTLGNTYYASQKEITSDAVDLVKRAAIDHPEYLAEMCVKGRNVGFIRTMPMIGLVALSETDPARFQDIFCDVVRTGNDMEDFITMVRAFGRGFGRSIKTAMQHWLHKNLNEFYAMKYTKQCGYAIRISRPNTRRLDTAHLYDYVMYYAKTVTDKYKYVDAIMKSPRLGAYETCKRLLEIGQTNQACGLIKEYGLDPAALIGVTTPTKEVWKALAGQMGVMMLLKYLSKLVREDAITQFVLDKITVESLLKAKVFPFRLYIAYCNIPSGGQGNMVRDHLASVLDDYVVQYDWGKWNKKIAIAPDVSGSMTSCVSGSSMTPAIIAGMLSGIIYKGVKTSGLLPWASSMRMNLVGPRQDSVLTHINRIANACGGGTHMHLPVDYLFKNAVECDLFIGITDSEEWGRGGWLNSWIAYKKMFPKAKAVLIRVDSYGTSPFSTEHAKKYDIYQVYGWNDSVLSYIETLL